MAGDEGKGGSGVRGYWIATAAWIRFSTSKPDSATSDRKKAENHVNFTANMESTRRHTNSTNGPENIDIALSTHDIESRPQ